MTEFFIAEIAPPADVSDEPSWAVRGYAATDTEHWVEVMGLAMSRYTEALLLEALADQTYGIKYYLLAIKGNRPDWPISPRGLPLVSASAALAPAPLPIVGIGSAILPLRDNLLSAHLVDVYVREPYRRHGIGSALLTEMENAIRAHGRSEAVGNSQQRHVTAVGDEHAISAAAGEGTLDRRLPMHQFRIKHGYTLGQTQRLSICPLPMPDVEAPKSSDYEIRVFPDGFPCSLYADIARLRVGMSVDAPSGEVGMEAEDWDAERVAAIRDRATASGLNIVNVGAFAAVTGELVAYTEVQVERARPENGHQGDTYVAREHRGHGLGLAIKSACYQALATVSPKTVRVITANASENDHMWAINRALGFREAGTTGWWFKRFRPQL